MSILIKGMAMPKNCYDCPFESHNRCYFSVMGLPNVVEAIDRPKACPLVEILTPHGRLIDADKLRAEFNRTESGYCGSWEFCDKPEDFQFLIDDEPTIIEAEE